jgi:hypothetical protein
VKGPSVRSQGKLLTRSITANAVFTSTSLLEVTPFKLSLLNLLDEIRFPTEVVRVVSAVKAFLISSACPQYTRFNNIFFACVRLRLLEFDGHIDRILSFRALLCCFDLNGGGVKAAKECAWSDDVSGIR